MRLSILTMCCDKDWQRMSQLINNISAVFNDTNKSFTDYEIIIADNRDKYKDEPVTWSEQEHTIVLPNDPKRVQYIARRQQTELCTGDYIWFVDGDDLIVNIPEVYEPVDIIGFPYFMGTDETTTAIDTLYTRDDVTIKPGLSITGTKYSDKGFTQEADTYIMGSAIMLWPKIIKKSVVEAALEILPAGLEIISGEDLLLWVACLSVAKSIYNYKKPCYFYNCADSLNHKPTFTFEQYSRMIKGVDDSFNILHDLVEKGKIYCTDKWINVAARNHCYIFAGKLLLVKDPDERAEAAKLLLSIFDSRTIETSILRYYLNMGISDRRTVIRTLLELDRLLSEGAPMEPSLAYLIEELGYGN